jgi:prepilin-type N-terminal cleavage/methylation domain-containing protein
MKKIHRTQGFTLVEIMVVVGVIGLLAAIAIPNFVRARSTSQQNACINNLRQINSAVQQWSTETGQAPGAAPPSMSTDLTPYIQLNSNNSVPICPSSGTYTINNVGVVPQVTCSFSTLPSSPHKLQ